MKENFPPRIEKISDLDGAIEQIKTEKDRLRDIIKICVKSQDESLKRLVDPLSTIFNNISPAIEVIITEVKVTEPKGPEGTDPD